MKNIIAANSSDMANIIGKLTYYTVGQFILSEKRIREALRECGIDDEELVPKKYQNVNAFKKATSKMQTGRIYSSKTDSEDMFRIRIFENKRENQGNLVVREIKKESIQEKMNKFTYLGNISYNKETDSIDFNIIEENIKDLNYDLEAACRMVKREFEIEKDGFNEDRMRYLLDRYMEEYCQASRIQIHGKLWFVPIFSLEALTKIEAFIDIITCENNRDGLLEIMSIPIIDEEKYVKRYSREFLTMAEAELKIFQNKLESLIENPGTRQTTLDAWMKKIDEFIEKKKRYEELFQRNYEEMSENIDFMKRQMQELMIRQELELNQIKLAL